MTTEHKPTIRRHGGTLPIPVEALLADDYELTLVYAPLRERSESSCRYEACESDEFCTCQEGESEE